MGDVRVRELCVRLSIVCIVRVSVSPRVRMTKKKSCKRISLEQRGIDPRTSRMLSERSTI